MRRLTCRPSTKPLCGANSADCSERRQWRETRKLRRPGRRDRRFQVTALATAVPATKVMTDPGIVGNDVRKFRVRGSVPRPRDTHDAVYVPEFPQFAGLAASPAAGYTSVPSGCARAPGVSFA